MTLTSILINFSEVHEFLMGKTMNCFKNLVQYFNILNDLLSYLPKYIVGKFSSNDLLAANIIKKCAD